MKQLLTGLFIILFSVCLNAQDAFYVSGGATAIRKTIIPIGDIGVKLNRNIIAFNMQTYDPVHVVQPRRVCMPSRKVSLDRKWVTGVKYERLIPISKVFFITPTATGGIFTDEDPRFVWTGGVGLQLLITRNFALQSITQFPLVQGTHGHYWYAGVQNGLAINYYLFK
jgi:hypothetical protein